MTIDEALLKVTDQEAKAFLQKVISDQNGYVTKLEAQIAELKKSPAQSQGTDDITRKYLEDNMRRDIINQATVKIKAAYGDAIAEACMPDYLEFLDKNMTLKNTTVEYATDAFNLVYGRCFAKKDHAVHNVGKATPSTPTPQVATGNNAAGVQQVASIINGQPPVMNPNDQSAGQGLPGTQGTPVKSTKDAFKAFRDRISQGGSSKFQ